MSIDAGSVMSYMDLDISPFKRNLNVAVSQLKGFMDTSNSIDTRLDSLGNVMGDFGAGITKNVTVPIAGLATAAVKFFGDFEEGVNKITTLDTENILDVKALKNDLLELSDDIGINVAELNESTYQMGSAMGEVSEDIVEYTGIASKAAIAGFTDSTTAVDGLSTAVNIYGDKSKETMQLYSDLMLNAQNKGKTTFGEMASTMGDILPIMAQLDMGMEDYATSMAVLTKNGLATNKATTGLKAAFSNIIKPTAEAEKAAEELGVSFNAAELKSKGLKGFISDLAKEISGGIPEYQALVDKQTELISQMDSMESSGQKNSDAYKELELQLRQTQEDMETMATATDSPIQKYAQLFGSVEGLNTMMVLSSERGMTDFNEILASMGDVAGMTEEAYQKMNEGVKDSWEDTWEKAKNTLIRFGDFIAPYVSAFFDKVSIVLDYINSTDEDTKKLIVTVGLVVAAMGPVLTVGGKLVSGMGTVVSMTKTVSQALSLARGAAIIPTSGAVSALASAFTVLSGPVGLAVLGVGAVAAGGYALYKNLSQEVIPQVDLFADKVHYTSDGMRVLDATISETTQNAVQSYLDLDQQATDSLMDLYYNSENITQEQATNLKSQYNQMTQDILGALEERQQSELDTMQQMFSESSALTEEEETDIITKTQNAYQEKRNTIEGMQQEILDILNEAAENNREITEEEAETIQEIQLRMKEESIKAMSDTEVEATVILERMKEHDGRITAEMASEKIKQLEESKNEAIAKAEEQYEEEISILIKQKEEMGILSQEQYDALVKDAQERRDKTIEEAEITKTQTVGKMVEMNSDLKDSVNLTTGEILTKWDGFKKDFLEKWDNTKENFTTTTSIIVESTKEEFKELGQDMKKKKDDLVNTVQTFVKDGIEEVKKLPGEFLQSGKDTVQGFLDGFNESVTDVIDNVGNFASNIITKFKDVLGIHSPSRVFYAMGEYVNEGLENGLADTSNGPADAMNFIADSLINTGNEISTGLIQINEETGSIIYDQMYVNLMDKTDLFFQEQDQRVSLMTQGTDETLQQMDREIQATENAYDIKMKLYEQEMYAKLSLIDDVSRSQVKELKDQIQAINDLNEADRKAEAKQRYEKQLAEKKEALQTAETAEEKSKILKQIEELKRNREKQLLRESRKEEQDALREQIIDIQEKATEDKAAIKDEYEAKKYQLEQQKKDEIEYLKDIQKVLKKDFKERKEYEENHTKLKEAENKKRTIQEIQQLRKREDELKISMNNNKITLENFTPEVERIGNEYGGLLLAGFVSTEDDLNDYLDSIVDKAEAVAKAVADAKEGEVSSARRARSLIADSTSFRSMVRSAVELPKYSSMAKENLFAMRATDYHTAETTKYYEAQAKKEKQELEIDYDKLGKAIANNTKPNITMKNEFNSPKALSEKEIRRNEELMLRDMAFKFG